MCEPKAFDLSGGIAHAHGCFPDSPACSNNLRPASVSLYFCRRLVGFIGDGAFHQAICKGLVYVGVAEASAVLQLEGSENFGVGEGSAMCQQHKESNDEFANWWRVWWRVWWRDWWRNGKGVGSSFDYSLLQVFLTSKKIHPVMQHINPPPTDKFDQHV